jgi:hypothetical protein
VGEQERSALIWATGLQASPNESPAWPARTHVRLKGSHKLGVGVATFALEDDRIRVVPDTGSRPRGRSMATIACDRFNCRSTQQAKRSHRADRPHRGRGSTRWWLERFLQVSRRSPAPATAGDLE